MTPKPPAYMHYSRDWLVDTASLSLEEQGAYQRLLDHEWIEGPMLDNAHELARRVSLTPRQFAKLWEVLGRFFVRGEDGRLRNPRLEQERQAQIEYRARQAERGRHGAEKRWHGSRHDERLGERHSEGDGDPNGTTLALQSASASKPSSASSDDNEPLYDAEGRPHPALQQLAAEIWPSSKQRGGRK